MANFPPNYSNVSISSGHTHTLAVPTNASWTTNTSAQGQLRVEGKDADIIINKRSMSDWMSSVEKRLSILQPKPELLKKYESLQQAFDHYKTLEALLHDEEKE